MSASAESEFRIIPIDQLHESPLNPRKTYNAKNMEDLVASVTAKGVITPLLVRPRPNGIMDDDHKGRTRVRENLTGPPGFEIAAGHRRHRAATAAGLAEVPAVVRPMDDVTFLEILIMENDEREDLHPLEEAAGYQTLMTKAGYTIERIAERRGCSVKYVYDRLKLLQLIPEVQELFREHRFTAGHAILLARLTPADQKRAIHPEKGGLWQHEQLLWAEEEYRPSEVLRAMKPVSVRELDAWIAEHVRFDPTAVEPLLFPETAATLMRALESEEKIIKITQDHFIQPEARDGAERTYGPSSWKRADGKKKSKSCEHAVTGVIVVGPGRGDAFRVCTAKEKCKTHWAAEQKERAQRAKANARAGKNSSADRWKREQEKREQERQWLDAEVPRWTKARPEILKALAAAVKKAPTRARGLLAEIILDQFESFYGHKDYAADYMPRGTTADDFIRHAAFRVLVDELQEWHAPTDFPKRAKAFGIDVRKIVDAAAPAAATKAAQTSAQTGKKK